MLSPEEAREMTLAAQSEASLLRKKRVQGRLEELYDRIQTAASEGLFEVSVPDRDEELDDALKILRDEGYKVSYDVSFQLNTINWS